MNTPAKLIALILACTDVDKLRNWISNAEREGADAVADAARRQLIEVMASSNIATPTIESPTDPLVLDFWKSITALEFELSLERGKTIRLARTRQKIARVGVQKTLADLTLQPTPSEGYFLLKNRDMLDLSAEAVVLRFPEQFDEDVINAARARLKTKDDIQPQ